MPLDENLVSGDPDQEHDENFAAYLREFHPLAPRPLIFPVCHRDFRPAWAVAALILIAIGLSVSWHRDRITPPHMTPEFDAARAPSDSRRPQALTVGFLNAMLRGEDEDFERRLAEFSPWVLPREHRGTVLYELSKE